MAGVSGFRHRRSQWFKRLLAAEHVFAVSKKTGKIYRLTQAQYADWIANPRAAAVEAFLTEEQAQGEQRRLQELTNGREERQRGQD